MRRTLTWLGVCCASVAHPAIADDAVPPPSPPAPSAPPAPETRFIFGSRLIARDTGGGAELDVRARFENGIQLGLAASGLALERATISGIPVRGVAGTSATGIFLAPLVAVMPLSLDLRFRSGASLFYDVGAEDPTALRQVNELGMFAHVALGERWLLRAGAVIDIEIEIGDAIEVADQAQLLDLGLGVQLSENVLAYASSALGGTFGFDGDNAKFMVEGSLGIRVPFGSGGARVAF